MMFVSCRLSSHAIPTNTSEWSAHPVGLYSHVRLVNMERGGGSGEKVWLLGLD
jgi:hypothetical protein